MCLISVTGERPMPHKGCYRAGHPKGGPVTKPARAEYTEAVRRRYVAAEREMKSRILDEYCRTLHCHRQAAIRALGRTPQPRCCTGGGSTEGFHLSSLVVVDVVSGWIGFEPIWGVGAVRVGAGVQPVHQRLPVPLREWHTDNGSEFLNRGLLRYCRRHNIRVTRGRPYRKNDQAWVELRNRLAVRRLVGRDRYSSHVAFGLLRRLYDLLRVQLNFFRPFRKVLNTRLVGSKRVRRYDRAQTPYQRLLAACDLADDHRRALEAQFLAVDPARLAAQIGDTLDRLWKCGDTRLSFAGGQVVDLSVMTRALSELDAHAHAHAPPASALSLPCWQPPSPARWKKPDKQA